MDPALLAMFSNLFSVLYSLSPPPPISKTGSVSSLSVRDIVILKYTGFQNTNKSIFTVHRRECDKRIKNHYRNFLKSKVNFAHYLMDLQQREEI